MEDERNAKIAILTGLAGNYSAKLEPETSKMWLFLLQDYPPSMVQAAALAVIRKHSDVPYRSMPPFAMLQAELDALDGTVRGEENVRLQAEAEWAVLLEKINPYEEPPLHPATERVVRMMGGWSAVCNWLEKDMNWRHKEFVDLWQTVAGKEDLIGLGAGAAAALALPSAERKRQMEGLQEMRQKLLEHISVDVREEPKTVPTDMAIKAYQEAFHKPKVQLSPELEAERARLVAQRDRRKGTAFQKEAV